MSHPNHSANHSGPAGAADPDTRRRFLRGAGALTLSAGTVALLAGCDGMAGRSATAAAPDRDVQLLNGAIGLEDQAIGAYAIALDSGLLDQPVRPLAELFRDHHRGHRDVLATVVAKLGGQPQAPKTLAAYAAELNAAALQNQGDILELALRLEREAADGYLKAIPDLHADGLGQAAARISADEVLHWTVLAQALGRPLPATAMSFGA